MNRRSELIDLILDARDRLGDVDTEWEHETITAELEELEHELGELDRQEEQAFHVDDLLDDIRNSGF